jgi:hypothetical protein
MFSLRTALLSPVALMVLSLPCIVGCAAQASDGDRASQADLAAVAPRSTDTHQTVTALTDAAKDAFMQKFVARNTGTWNKGSFELPNVDQFRPFIKYAWRTDAPGTNQTMTALDAEEKAMAFVKANADLLGVVNPDALKIETAPPPDGSIYHGKYQFFSTFTGTYTQPGYEGFAAATTQYDVAIGIHNDGEIRAVLNGTDIPPDLTLSTEAAFKPSDARVLAHVLGTPIAHYEPIGHDGFETVYKKTDLGTLTAHDVSAIELSIFTQTADDLSSESFSLSYALTVRKQGYVLSFTVDAADGSVLDQPTVPFGIIR